MDLSKYQDAVFQYGTLDCCLFVCDVIQEQTGRDLAARWRNAYRSETGALRLIARAGGFEKLMCQAFGEMKPIWSVKPGNPVLLDPSCLETDSVNAGLGIYDGSQIIALTDQGIIKLPVLAGRRCWNI